MTSAKDKLAKKQEYDRGNVAYLSEPVMISGPKPPRKIYALENFFNDPLWPLITLGGAATVYALIKGFKALSKKDSSMENLRFQNKMMRMRIGAQFATVMVCFSSYILYKQVKPNSSSSSISTPKVSEK